MPRGPKSSANAAASESAPPPPAASPDATPPAFSPAEPVLIPTEKIRRNERNPRLLFAEGPLERLADSIEETGVLVPITVYRDVVDADGTEFVLLDGERRLRASKLTNAPNIPGWVVPKPDEKDNALRMFNIHMLREPWGDIATTWAFRDLKKETGVTDDRKLQRLTGLTIDAIRNMNRVLAFPQDWQDMVFEGKLPFNLLIELDKSVLSKAKDESKSAALQDRSTAELRSIFLEKYLGGTFRDVVDLRKVGALIDTATKEGRTGARAKKALRKLLEKPEVSIDEAFEVGAAGSIDLTKIMNDMENLPSRVEDLSSANLDKTELRVLAAAANKLAKRLQEIAKNLVAS